MEQTTDRASRHPGFFQRVAPLALRELAVRLNIDPTGLKFPNLLIEDIMPLGDAGPKHMAFLDNRKYLRQLGETRAAACLIQADFVERLPVSVAPLVTPSPYRSFAQALSIFYPEAMHPRTTDTMIDGPAVDQTAIIESGVKLEHGAVIGAQARIGRGSVIASGAVIGYRVVVGDNCYIGPRVTLTHTILGDRVVIHAGASIGQDGFGFAMGPGGHLKVPQIGRVLIHDNVEIGANTTIDRGALKDTVIGEGTKIDNLVQIGHNVVVGRHCILVAHTGISGSVELGDFVVMGGQSGTSGHVRIGTGAQIAGAAAVNSNVPAGAKYGGIPARPFVEWAREVAFLRKIGVRKKPEGARET